MRVRKDYSSSSNTWALTLSLLWCAAPSKIFFDSARPPFRSCCSPRNSSHKTEWFPQTLSRLYNFPPEICNLPEHALCFAIDPPTIETLACHVASDRRHGDMHWRALIKFRKQKRQTQKRGALRPLSGSALSPQSQYPVE